MIINYLTYYIFVPRAIETEFPGKKQAADHNFTVPAGSLAEDPALLNCLSGEIPQARAAT